jgi:6-phosphogluconolactonase
MNGQVKIFPNLAELNNFAAEKFVETAHEAIEKRGRFNVALAGGSTPKALYRLLSSDSFKGKVDWRGVFFFFGDERNVLPDDPESNFRMAEENLFKPLAINDQNIFRWRTELKNAEKIANDYEETLKSFFFMENPPATAGGTDLKTPPATADDTDHTVETYKLPRFDLILLGMGADGHTASLFPFTEALRETEKLAVANPLEKLDTTRLTLTFPVINNARHVIFLVAGAEKAETLKAVLEGQPEPRKLPSQNINPKNGNLLWLLDEKAAALLIQ